MSTKIREFDFSRMGSGRLMDRFVREDGTLVLRAQNRRTGTIVDVVLFSDDDGTQAACIRGGATVEYYHYPDGRCYFLGVRALDLLGYWGGADVLFTNSGRGEI